MVKFIDEKTIPGFKSLEKEFIYGLYPKGLFDPGKTIGVVHPDMGCLNLTIDEACELVRVLHRALSEI